MLKLDKFDLESLELDIARIRREGSVENYVQSNAYSNELLISRLEMLLKELKRAEGGQSE